MNLPLSWRSGGYCSSEFHSVDFTNISTESLLVWKMYKKIACRSSWKHCDRHCLLDRLNSMDYPLDGIHLVSTRKLMKACRLKEATQTQGRLSFISLNFRRLFKTFFKNIFIRPTILGARSEGSPKILPPAEVTFCSLACSTVVLGAKWIFTGYYPVGNFRWIRDTQNLITLGIN